MKVHAAILSWLEQLEKAVTYRFEEAPRTEGWDRVPPSVDPRFKAGLPFPVPEILEFKAFGDPGTLFQHFFRNFPDIFLGNPRKAPRNSHSSLLEFSESWLYFEIAMLCSDATLAVAIIAIKVGQVGFWLQSLLAMSPAIQKIAIDCGWRLLWCCGAVSTACDPLGLS